MSDERRPSDPLPALIAELDQTLALLPQMARLARGYQDAFTGEGFTESQALYLAATQILQNPGTAP